MKMKPELLKCISEETSLENNIKIVCEMAFITLLSDLGYREEKGWTDDENELLSRLLDSASNLASSIMMEINEYEKPKESDLKEFYEKIYCEFFGISEFNPKGTTHNESVIRFAQFVSIVDWAEKINKSIKWE